MKIGIMQPYFMPYIGYWQLMNAVDKYVIFDDVNYINRGWINRNRIFIMDNIKYINIPLLGASQNKTINEISLNPDPQIRQKALRTILTSYKKAPYFDTIFPLIEKIFLCESTNLSLYLKDTFDIVNEYLDIRTDLIFSSSIKKDPSLRGQDKVIAICKSLNATDYYNAIGGKELYSKEIFVKNNINLHFLHTEDIIYQQFSDHFFPNLSLIDVLMFNSKDEVKHMLNQYTLE